MGVGREEANGTMEYKVRTGGMHLILRVLTLEEVIIKSRDRVYISKILRISGTAK